LEQIKKFQLKIDSKTIETIVDKAYFNVKDKLSEQISPVLGQSIEKIFIKSKNTGMGPEKVASFFYKKFNAYNNIRLILFAKKNNIPAQEIENNILPI